MLEGFITICPSLDAFAKLQKATISFVMSASLSSVQPPSVRPYGPTRLSLLQFSWNLVFEHFRKIFQQIQVSLKSEKNNGYFTWRRKYVYDNISLHSSYNDKLFGQEFRGHQNTHFTINHFFRRPCRLWDDVEKYYRAGQATDDNIIRRVHSACWVRRLQRHAQHK